MGEIKSLTKKEVVAEFRRREILRSAREVFAREGFQEATMEKIAQNAGISKGTIYLYFKNKTDLFFQAIDERLDEFISLIRNSLKIECPPLKKIWKVVTTQMEFFEAHKEFFKVCLCIKGGLHLEHPQDYFERLNEKFQNYIDGISRVIEEGGKQGTLHRVEPIKGAHILAEMINSLIFYRIINEPTNPISQDEKLIYRVFLKGFLKKGEELP